MFRVMLNSSCCCKECDRTSVMTKIQWIFNIILSARGNSKWRKMAWVCLFGKSAILLKRRNTTYSKYTCSVGWRNRTRSCVRAFTLNRSNWKDHPKLIFVSVLKKFCIVNFISVWTNYDSTLNCIRKFSFSNSQSPCIFVAFLYRVRWLNITDCDIETSRDFECLEKPITFRGVLWILR